MQMIIGVLTLDIHIQTATSLKEKRMVLKSFKDKIRKKFNVSIAEIDYQDKWQRSKISIVQVGNDYHYIQEIPMTEKHRKLVQSLVVPRHQRGGNPARLLHLQ